MSRRAIVSGLKKSLRKNVYRAAVSRIPQLEEADRDGLRYRRLLAQAVRAERDRLREAQQAGGGPETLPTYPMSLPAYTTACFGCSICERICPQQALEIRVEEGGTRLICITPWKCTACGLCTEICPHGGLQGLEKIAVPFLEQLPLARVPTESCEQCGVAIRPGTAPALCPSCRAKKKRLRR
jgi:formate hydrogenlyase subunit 6/NADH:ubiquinone oxidoreductase subunit I